MDSPSTAQPAAPQARTQGRLALVLGVAGAIVVADLLTKLAAVAWLENEEPVRLLGGIAELDVTRNSGAAFSIGTGYTVVFPLIAIVVAAVVIHQARRLTSTAWAITLGALLGGALGNLGCRIFRDPGVLRGHVVDFVEIGSFPVFNVADSAITLAAVALIALSVLGIGLDGRRAHRDEDAEVDGA